MCRTHSRKQNEETTKDGRMSGALENGPTRFVADLSPRHSIARFCRPSIWGGFRGTEKPRLSLAFKRHIFARELYAIHPDLSWAKPTPQKQGTPARHGASDKTDTDGYKPTAGGGI